MKDRTKIDTMKREYRDENGEIVTKSGYELLGLDLLRDSCDICLKVYSDEEMLAQQGLENECNECRNALVK